MNINDNACTFNERKTPLYEVRSVDKRSLLGLYFSEILLFLGFMLILFNNIGLLAPGTYFGAFSWVTASVFSIGLTINFVVIPYLYFSSFKNFKKENGFWDKETFLILPLFFFGTFFLYGSEIFFSWTILAISLVLIAVVHYNFLKSSWKFLMESSDEALMMQQEYFLSMKYLTAYYLLLLFLMILINPLQMMFVWLRMHI